MNTQNTTECCPKFDPTRWDGRVVTWDKKPFLQDRVRSFVHIPLNFGAVMKRSVAAITAAGAASEEVIVLSDENSLWGADVYIAVTKEVPGARMASLSGTYLAKVFEGPYRTVSQHAELDRGDASLREGPRQAPSKGVVLLHDMPEVREEIRQELCRHPGASVTPGQPGWSAEIPGRRPFLDVGTAWKGRPTSKFSSSDRPALTAAMFNLTIQAVVAGPEGYTNGFLGLPAAADWATYSLAGATADAYHLSLSSKSRRKSDG